MLSACSSTQTPYDIQAEPTVAKSLQRYTREAVLVPGDQLEIAVYRNADVSRTVLIRPDGYISLPLLDEVKAAGVTILELDAILTERLGKRLKDPEITVILVNPMDPMVYVFGDVGVATPVPLRKARTLAQALAYARGITRDAAIEDIAVVRLDDDGYLKMHTLQDKAEGPVGHYMAYQNTPLKADDLIVVPESRRSLAGRFIQDFISEPLGAVNLVLTPYFQYRLIEEII